MSVCDEVCNEVHDVPACGCTSDVLPTVYVLYPPTMYAVILPWRIPYIPPRDVHSTSPTLYAPCPSPAMHALYPPQCML